MKNSKKRVHPIEKVQLHPRNKHRERYNFKLLVGSCPDLLPFVRINEFKDESIDFSDSEAVKMLNKALLKHFYQIKFWDIPPGYLCPPIPGRVDYIHYLADLAGISRGGKIPIGPQIHCLDIGVGANCIYPIIGCREYGWSFTGTDIDLVSLKVAGEIINSNSNLTGKIDLRLQPNSTDILSGIIKKGELFDMTLCNPPFHSSLEEANSAALKKTNNLNQIRSSIPNFNFGGNSNELWCPGGEARFIHQMVIQSKSFANSCFWFTTLVSKKSTLASIYNTLKKMNVTDSRTIPIGQGNKKSRIVAWTFLTENQQKEWVETRWLRK